MSHIKGRLVPLWAALDPDLQLMELIPTAWRNGTITLWGRRKAHAMLEPIGEYRGLVIDWVGGPPKGDYQAEAYAHPSVFGAGYYENEWEDLAILEGDLDHLRAVRGEAAPIGSDSTERSDCTETASTIKATPKKSEIECHANLANAALSKVARQRELRPAVDIDPSVGRAAGLSIQKSEQPPTTFPCETPRGGAIPYRSYLPGTFMPEGYMPVLEAASLLAFGDPEFLDHILETKFLPEIGRELLVPKESCPEIDRELGGLVHKHTVGGLIIIGRRRAVPEWRNQVRHPDPIKGEICNRYDAIPPDYFRFNDWSFGALDPFGVVAKGSDPFGAEWFYPAIELSDVERLRGAASQVAMPHGASDMSEPRAVGIGGRKPGSGAMDDEDALRRMLEILAQGEAPSVFAAAGIVVRTGGVGGASVESTRRRLSRKFTDRYGTEPPAGQVWSDIVG